tara:strand:- start:19 stop:210 length:192 start_codon:yes stop_codon:yes gene_type:complete
MHFSLSIAGKAHLYIKSFVFFAACFRGVFRGVFSRRVCATCLRGVFARRVFRREFFRREFSAA